MTNLSRLLFCIRLGQQVHILRLDRGMGRRDLAETLGITELGLVVIEAGIVDPSALIVHRICQTFGADEEAFYQVARGPIHEVELFSSLLSLGVSSLDSLNVDLPISEETFDDLIGRLNGEFPIDNLRNQASWFARAIIRQYA